MTGFPSWSSMKSFDVISVIGEGTYGVVHKCRCKQTGTIVAVKQFKMNANEYARRVILREMRVLNLLKGESNVTQLLGVFREKGQTFLVMEYVDGNLLDVILQLPSGVPMPQLKNLLYTLFLALRSCHHNGVIHRDVKPENTLVRHGKISVLCDFGTSRTVQLPRDASSSSGGLLNAPTWRPPPLTDYVATRWYRSPEMLLGIPHYSFSSDMWAAGAIMAELATGEPFFPGSSEVDQLKLIFQRVGGFSCLLTNFPGVNSVIQSLSAEVAASGNGNCRGAESYLDRRFRKVLGESGLDLLRSLLTVDPMKRCTVDEALAHPFFGSLVSDSSFLPTSVECRLGRNVLGSRLYTAHQLVMNRCRGAPIFSCDGHDKWFGLGEGKPVHLQEIELLHDADTVEPRVVDTLLQDMAATKVNLSKFSGKLDVASARFADSKSSQLNIEYPFSCEEEKKSCSKSSSFSLVQLPSIALKQTRGHPHASSGTCALSSSTLFTAPLTQPSVGSFVFSRSVKPETLNCCPDVNSIEQEHGKKTSGRNVTVSGGKGSMNSENEKLNNSVTNLAKSFFKGTRQTSLRKKGRLVFTSKKSVESS